MNLAIPQYEVGAAQNHGGLAVFPLFAAASNGPDYLLGTEALRGESVIVEEVSEAGSVPDLVVKNLGNHRLLFLEGEELIGAKQNRVLNTSVLIAAMSSTKIPVSCVEEGRWGYRSRQFGTSGSHATSRIRYAVKESVARSLEAGFGHRSDQGKVWQEVQNLEESLGVASSTHAMADVYEAHQEHIAEAGAQLPYVEGAVGMAVALGDKVVAADLFDKPSTCQSVWSSMLSGFIFDAQHRQGGLPRAKDVEQLLSAARAADWVPVEPVGEGEEYRAEIGRDRGSALCFDGVLVHGSIAAAL